MAKDKLSAVTVKQAKPGDKPYKLTDGCGMYLLVTPDGSKYWRLNYRFGGRQKTLALGVFPEVSLERARRLRDDARLQLAEDNDPSQTRKLEKLRIGKADDSFEVVAREWHTKFSPSWSESNSKRNIRILELNAFPWIGNRPVGQIEATELLAVLRRAETRQLLDTAHRLRQVSGMVFRYAIATGRAERDPSQDLRGALAPRKQKHYAALTESESFGALLRSIWSYNGGILTCYALKLSALFGLRPGEVRKLEWKEVDFPSALIHLPMGKMKARRMHTVPLASQAIEILKELKALSGDGRLCFPGLVSKERPLSENTANLALRRMGYSADEATAHGFRSSFSTLAHGSGLWRPEVVEIQLAHKHGNATRLAYDRGDFLDERRKLMQWWADECERMRLEESPADEESAE